MAKKAKATMRLGTDVKSVAFYVHDSVSELQVKDCIEAVSKGVVTEVSFVLKSGMFDTPIPDGSIHDKRTMTFVVKNEQGNRAEFISIPFMSELPTNALFERLKEIMSTSRNEDEIGIYVGLYKNSAM